MAVSSGTISLFSAVAIAIAAAAAGAYGLKHKAEFKGFARHLAEAGIGTPADMSGEDGAGNDGTDGANASQGESADAGDATGDSTGDAGAVTLRAGDHGHFETEAEINGRGVAVMVDTGATMVALTFEDAERAGIFLKPADFTQSVATANGAAKIAPVDISSVSIGGITVRNVKGAVSERGKLHRTLLGMSFLGRLSRVDMRSKTLILHE